MRYVPDASLGDVLDRVQDMFVPRLRPNHLFLGSTGAGKTMLIRTVAARVACTDRMAAFDPKENDDPSWTIDEDTIGPAPRPVTALVPGFGLGQDGGPAGTWIRLIASHDQAITQERFTAGLQLLRQEGHCLTVLDDARTLNRSLRLEETIEKTVLLGRSAGLSCFISSQEPTHLVVRAQTAFKWIGHLGSLQAAKTACGLLGVRGAAWEDTILSLRQGEWIYTDDAPGSGGPCRFRSWDPSAAQ